MDVTSTDLYTEIDMLIRLIDQTVQELAGKKANEPGEQYFDRWLFEYTHTVHPATEAIVDRFSFYMDKPEHNELKQRLQLLFEAGLNQLHHYLTRDM